MHVAINLIIPMIIMILHPQLIELLFIGIIKIIEKIRKIKKKLTCEEFLSFYSFENFNLNFRFLNVLKMVFIGLFLSNSFPLFYFTILLGLVITFWIHKYILINYSNKVPPYSHEIILSIIRTMKVAVFLHLLKSVHFFTD